ncbi:FKBP-type peptidyl-prolyl cis-trans isomerase [Aliikangiella marina]|uniref:Peptidyl-prolyl cis-trans isomerase n=1 Tax=Aliikangiella marina TaxID=1712262 RepID=A0A545T909_9GAMM|nr:FKBP-type peptidyl-prolyl cis-trans isomerase [Aliikangiella marina]TQV73668.1 FKBP-type peptidyl-prolyl cis-trans isomerase [Aliikangiella marina]
MKYKIAALAVGLLLAGCQQQDAAQTEKKAEAEQTQEKTALVSDVDKMAYALGADMANTVKRISGEYKAVTMSDEALLRGFSEALKGQSALQEEEIRQQVMIFQQKLQFAQQQKMQEEAAKRDEENTAFMAKKDAEGYTKTESGLRYKVLTEAAEGAAVPAATDKVKVHYTGRLIDDSVFDSSVERDQPFEFSLTGGVIQGWLEGVKLMPVGSKYQFVIPPELGYGPRGNSRIPGNSILVFDVELLEIVQPKEATPSAKE